MLGMPGVLHTDKNGNTRMIDLTTRLLCDRIIMVTGTVTDELAESVVAQMLYLEAEDQDKPIKLFISGPGGSVLAGFSIIDVMQNIKCPVHTIACGQIASMSTTLFLSGAKGYRKIYPTTRVMLHQVSSGAQGNVNDMLISMEETKKVNEITLEHIAKCTGKTVKQLKKDFERDRWWSAQEAIEYGIADALVEKKVS